MVPVDPRIPYDVHNVITRLVDGLVGGRLIERVSCPNDARVSYAHLTDVGLEKLRFAGYTHVASIQRLFLDRFSPDELELLAAFLRRLPGATGTGACTVGDGDSDSDV